MGNHHLFSFPLPPFRGLDIFISQWIHSEKQICLPAIHIWPPDGFMWVRRTNCWVHSNDLTHISSNIALWPQKCMENSTSVHVCLLNPCCFTKYITCHLNVLSSLMEKMWFITCTVRTVCCKKSWSFLQWFLMLSFSWFINYSFNMILVIPQLEQFLSLMFLANIEISLNYSNIPKIPDLGKIVKSPIYFNIIATG